LPRGNKERTRLLVLSHQNGQPDISLEAPPGEAGSHLGLLRLLSLFGKLRAWATGHWLRGMAVAGTILVLIAATMAGWAYLASIALRSGVVSLDVALRALDQGRYAEARSTVGRILKTRGLSRSKYGGPLYVLGAIKAHDADIQSAEAKRRIEYLVASRYLNEANRYGIPAGRETHGLFLLGKSLLESGQYEEGIRTLSELLEDKLSAGHPLAWEAHRLLAVTCLLMPHPNSEKALQHADALLGKPDLSVEQRTDVLLQRGECLNRLGRFEDAHQVVGGVPAGTGRQAEIELMRGKIVLDETSSVLARIAPPERKSALEQRATNLTDAVQRLQQAALLDQQKGEVTRQTSYHLGRALEVQGKQTEAIKQFASARQLFGDTLEGLAAALAEADLLRHAGDMDGALLGYRRVLEFFDRGAPYRSVVLPLAQVRQRLMIAVKDIVQRERYEDALALLEHFPPLFSRAEQLELKGDTLEKWGNNLLANRAPDSEQLNNDNQTAGLRKLRAAGMAFERLAELRFATNLYTSDLWRSAENYFRGRSFSRTAELLTEYLVNEPELRNSEALLRLGEAYFALGRMPQSIAALEECIEFHPLESSAYQARIDCAKACWNTGNLSRAEQLLRDNLAGSALTPASREWKDSQFELGTLLHESGRYEEAIGTLESAIERYAQDPRRLAAQFVLGESYRRWAQEPLERMRQARTANERDKKKELSTDRLNTALANFEEVQRTITLKEDS
jgi:tetratricopeptide (TPR) repeat protein